MRAEGEGGQSGAAPCSHPPRVSPSPRPPRIIPISAGVLTVQPEDSPAIIRRRLAGAVDRKRPAEVTKSGDNRLVVLHLPKAELGEEWGSLFEGDPRGARRLVPAYRWVSVVTRDSDTCKLLCHTYI